MQSIQAKVSLAIAIAAIAMAVAGALMFGATQKLARLPADLYERPFKVGLALRDIRADLLLVHNNLRSLAEAL